VSRIVVIRICICQNITKGVINITNLITNLRCILQSLHSWFYAYSSKISTKFFREKWFSVDYVKLWSEMLGAEYIASPNSVKWFFIPI
jgi:hypothetical protein